MVGTHDPSLVFARASKLYAVESVQPRTVSTHAPGSGTVAAGLYDDDEGSMQPATSGADGGALAGGGEANSQIVLEDW